MCNDFLLIFVNNAMLLQYFDFNSQNGVCLEVSTPDIDFVYGNTIAPMVEPYDRIK